MDTRVGKRGNALEGTALGHPVSYLRTKRRMGRRTAGRLPSPKIERANQERREEDALQRALEQEMGFRLHEENMELKNQIWELQHKWKRRGLLHAGWSEVTSGSGGRMILPPPPDPAGQREWQRFTPNGTKARKDPPPGGST